LIAQLSQLTYRCPKCGDTFVADGEGSVAAGCPSCRESPVAGWYLKVRGEVVGPVSFEALPEQVNKSAVLVRQAGEADWTPVTSVLPAKTGTPARAETPPAEFEKEFDVPEEPPARRLFLPLATATFAVVVLAGGWVYHRVTLARAVEGQNAAGDADSTGAPSPRHGTLLARNGELGEKVQQLEKQLAVADYRRQLLIEVTARQERKLAAQIQNLKTATRSRRFRRFRGGFDPADDDAAKTLMTDFRRRLALAWAATLARREDAAAELAFHAAEVKRISGAPAKSPLQPHDRQLLKQNGVKYRTRYNTFYTSAHKELTLYMEYATAEELVLFASHERLSFPSGKLPADFAAAVQKFRK
jgi:GYF domain 2